MLQSELKKFITRHEKWLKGKKGGERANLSCANLSDANLSDANLSCADLRNANLSRANLSCANLSDANLSDANLSCADLRNANLRSADLSDANLRSANLSCANLSGANLSRANLRSAYLGGANLSRADLSCANLSDADLSGANLRSAYLGGAKNLETVYYNELTSMFALICPEKGSFTAFKKLQNNIIAELFIPAKAKRSSATTRKCRASEAKVVKMWNYETQEVVTTGISRNDTDFIYKTGETVKPTTPFDENRWIECSSGIHFFMTKKEAINYN